MQGVAGRVAVVTGAGQGNGRAVALGLARAGAHVALCDVDRERLEETTADVAAEGGRVFSAFADVSDREACRTFAAGCREELGEAEILVNNAGIIRRQRLNSDEFDQGWDDIFRVNVDGLDASSSGRSCPTCARRGAGAEPRLDPGCAAGPGPCLCGSPRRGGAVHPGARGERRRRGSG